MIYTFKNTFDRDLSVFCENSLPPRSYFDVFSNKAVATESQANPRKTSDRMILLDGEWGFKYFGNGKLPKKNAVNTDTADLDKVTLPNSLQTLGYEPFKYNIGYPFKNKPPFIKNTKSNPVPLAVFVKKFDISDDSANYIINFTKISGSLELHVNGKYCGYTELGCGEFDITKYVKAGENELAVLVRKYSKHSYLDGANKFDMFGLTGDIIIFASPKGGIFDYTFTTDKIEGGFSAKLALKLIEGVEGNIGIALYDDGNLVYSDRKTSSAQDIEFSFEGEYEEYTATKHKQYQLVLTALNREDMVIECVPVTVAFSKYIIDKGALSVKNTPVKLNAVSYNCQYNNDGSLLKIEDIAKDLIIIKNYNFNAVQFNVPIDPTVYAICEKIGLYVIADCGISTHASKLLNKKCPLDRMVIYASYCELKARYTYALTKNCAALALYSLGDENAKTPLMLGAYGYLSGVAALPVVANNNEYLHCLTHPSLDKLDKEISLDSQTPIYLNLYGLSKGVGCACVREFNDIINSAPNCIGGAMCEFVDNEVNGVGTVDSGLFNARRQPYAVAESAKRVFCPYQAKLISENKISVTNSNYFMDDPIKILIDVIKDGVLISSAEFEAMVPPNSTREYEVFFGHIDRDMYVNLTFVKDKRVIGSEQFTINTQLINFDLPVGKKLTQYIKNDNLVVDFDGGSVVFNRTIGKIVRYEIKGENILKSKSVRKGGKCFDTNLYRPFARVLIGRNDKYTEKLRDFECVPQADRIDVNVETTFYWRNKEAYIAQDKYSVYANGKVEVFCALTPLKHTKKLPNLDCFGKQLRLHNEYGLITYYGKGASDNYLDISDQAKMGLYKTDINSINEIYMQPQECGNRTNVYYATVTNNDLNGIAIRACNAPLMMRFNANSDEELANAVATHTKTIKQSGVYVDVNSFVSGIGCSEQGSPVKKYIMKPGEYVVQFEVIPLLHTQW